MTDEDIVVIGQDGEPEPLNAADHDLVDSRLTNILKHSLECRKVGVDIVDCRDTHRRENSLNDTA